jgi:hypothetical protein
MCHFLCTLTSVPRQCQYYSYGRTKSVSVRLVCGLSTVLAGFEAGMVFALRVCTSIWCIACEADSGSSSHPMTTGVEATGLSSFSESSARSSFPLRYCALVVLLRQQSSPLLMLTRSPQYYEIYKHREVIGISLPFVTVDLLGGVFSDLSLAFKESFDVIASLTYSLVVVLF